MFYNGLMVLIFNFSMPRLRSLANGAKRHFPTFGPRHAADRLAAPGPRIFGKTFSSSQLFNSFTSMKQRFLGVSLLLLGLAACNKDELIVDDVPLAPTITIDSETSSYTIKRGRALTLSPGYEHVDGAIYTWIFDGRVVGSEPDYTFCADEPGSYYLTVEVATRYGTAREELRVDVCELEIPYIALPGCEAGYRILAGTSLEFDPVVAETSLETRCTWSIDGAVVAERAHYTFRSSEKGLFEFRFETANEDGGDSVAFTVQVCSPDEMPFSWSFERTEINTSRGRTVRLMPFDIENAFEVVYTWSCDGQTVQQGPDPMLRFVPDRTGTAAWTITASSPYFDAVSQTLTVNVYEPNAHKRAASAASALYSDKVYDITPAPGQFVAQISTSTNPADAVAAAERALAARTYVSLGGYGGSIVVGFDHSIENHGGYDFAVQGNSFDNSSEPGIVWVMQDENGNGLPDDTWYELKGSEYGKPETLLDYAVTYYRPRSSSAPVPWTDSEGNSGSITLNVRYPDWIAADRYTLRGSRLAARNQDTSGSGTYWENRNYDWGYADNYSLIDRLTNDGFNYFRISDAVDFEGKPVELPYIDFVKVQCAVNATSGWLGEISTEVLGFKDYNLEQTRK